MDFLILLMRVFSSVALASFSASGSQTGANHVCMAAKQCFERGYLCIFVQVRRSEIASFQSSEAYGDMQIQIESLEMRQKGVHFLTVGEDLSDYFSNLPKTNSTRTFFLGRGGASLSSENLFVDDLTPIENYLSQSKLPAEYSSLLIERRTKINSKRCP